MVEMLGVLAIIGVLSVGGISGYSKAMAKYKLTKAQDQMAMILINIRTAFAAAPSYAGLDGKNAIAMNIIPSDMLPQGATTASNGIKNAFGGAVTIATASSDTQFKITYDGLGTEACTSLASSDWGSDGLVSIVVGGDGEGAKTAQGGPGDPITPTEAVAACGSAGASNRIVWTYY